MDSLPGSPLLRTRKAAIKPMLVSGTLSEVVNPFPTFGEQLPRGRVITPVELKSTPVNMVNTKTPVDLFKNSQKAPGTKASYGMVMPDRF